MFEKNKSHKSLDLRDFLKRKIRKINQRQDRLTKTDINTLLDKGVSRLDYPEPDTPHYRGADV